MIPRAAEGAVLKDSPVVRAADQPSRTYGIDFDRGRVAGVVDGAEAMRQAILKILRTERFSCLIYSWNYGVELGGCFGQRFPVVQSEVRRTVREALLQDGRIFDVRDIAVSQAGRRDVQVSFTAVTVFGDLSIDEEVGTRV